MGQEAPGYRIRLLDPDDQVAEEGEVCIALDPAPTGLMRGYQNDDGSFAAAAGRRPIAPATWRHRDADGYLTYVGRADDVFKASDYRISPFELESALIEHPAVAEAAVVPAPDADAHGGAEGICRAGRGDHGGPRHGTVDLPATCASGWRHSSGCAAWNSPTCRRPSPARSAASSCARRKSELAKASRARARRSSARRIFRN